MEVAEYLLQHGADVNAQDKGGLIPLHNAASYGVSSSVLPFKIYVIFQRGCQYHSLNGIWCDLFHKELNKLNYIEVLVLNLLEGCCVTWQYICHLL